MTAALEPVHIGPSTSADYAPSVLWLWELFSDFAEAVGRGDKSWWPFILSATALAAMAVGLAVWLA